MRKPFAEIYFAKIDPLMDEILYQRLYESLPAQRKEKVDRIVEHDDKMRSIAVYCLLRKAFSRHKIALDKHPWSYESYQKPFLEDCSIHFNHSHSGDYVICVLSDDLCGVDVEQIKNRNDSAMRFLSEKDQAFISSSSAPLYAFYRIWTFKESYTKALGLGITKPFSEFDIDLENNSVGKYRFFDIPIARDYLAAAALKTKAGLSSIEEVKLE